LDKANVSLRLRGFLFWLFVGLVLILAIFFPRIGRGEAWGAEVGADNLATDGGRTTKNSLWAEKACGAEVLEINNVSSLPADIRQNLEENLRLGKCMMKPLRYYRGIIYSFGTFKEEIGKDYYVLSAWVSYNGRELVYKNSRKICIEGVQDNNSLDLSLRQLQKELRQ